jgi:hypothetical protein
VTTFEPVEVEALLRQEGFDEIAHFMPADAALRYFDAGHSIHVGGSQ